MLTACVFVPVVLYIVLVAAPVWLVAAVSLITLLALLEYNKMAAASAGDVAMDALALVAGLAMAPLYYACGPASAVAVMVILVFALFSAGMYGGHEHRVVFLSTALRTLGVAYVALPMAYLVSLRTIEGGRYWVFFLLGVIWINDSMAYITGRYLGRHKLSPVVSPNKTWEGAVGGLVFGAVAGVVLNHFLDLGMEVYAVAVLSLVIGVVAIVGDLAESVIKRGAGVKDSGSIIPGHGGMLDRIDSIIFAVPALYYCVRWYFAA